MTTIGKIAPRLRLKEDHPTAVKVAKLCDLADELGIGFSFYGQRVVVEDRERDSKLPPLYLEDIEDGHWFSEFPFTTEYKMVYDNPAYVEQQKKEQAERDHKRAEEARVAKEREEAKVKAEADRRARELEASERKLLATLKEKYEK
jgi:hypothetical protein